MFGLPSILSVLRISALYSIFTKETPNYLCQIMKYEEAKASLEDIYLPIEAEE